MESLKENSLNPNKTVKMQFKQSNITFGHHSHNKIGIDVEYHNESNKTKKLSSNTT